MANPMDVISVKASFVSLISFPTHPLGLGWKIPILRIEPSDGAEPCFELELSVMGSAVAIEKLRRVGHPTPPPRLCRQQNRVAPGGRHDTNFNVRICRIFN